MSLNESIVESAALDWFAGLGYAVAHGPHLAPGEPEAERDSFSEVLLVGRLRDAIARLNPTIPADAREDALRRVVRIGTPSLIQTNRAFHKLLRNGVEVEYRRPDGSIAGDHVRLVDFTNPAANDWLVVNPAHEMRQPRVERSDTLGTAAPLEVRSPERAEFRGGGANRRGRFRPFRARGVGGLARHPGRCPGLSHWAPLGPRSRASVRCRACPPTRRQRPARATQGLSELV